MTFRGALQDPWHSPTLTAPFTESADVRYRLDAASNVHLRGEVVRNAAASGALLFVLPEPYRPDATVRFIIAAAPAGDLGQVAFEPDGDVRLYVRAGTPTDYYLDCTFSVL